jgi:Na+-transporting oxaloacetate decarboxylase beta subunit
LAEQLFSFLGALIDQTGLARFWWGNVVMIAIGCVMIYLAVSKRYEPLLLVGIGFSCIISNVPGSGLIQPGGLFHYAYQGVALLVVPPLIFFGDAQGPHRLRDLPQPVRGPALSAAHAIVSATNGGRRQPPCLCTGERYEPKGTYRRGGDRIVHSLWPSVGARPGARIQSRRLAQ